MPNLPELEGDQIFSARRLWRGATTGLKTSVALTACAAAITAPEHGVNLKSLEIAFFITAVQVVPTFALVDWFRPTSRLVKRQVEKFIEDKDLAVGTIHRLKDQAGQKVHNLLRPSVYQSELDNKRAALLRSTFLGAASGAALCGSIKFIDLLFQASDKIFGTEGEHAGSAIPLITDDPLRTIFAGAALVTAAKAYSLTFHGAIKPEEPEDEFDPESFEDNELLD
ncbi:MAG: hypothetical protein M1426_00770 [Patescibacteria group bacterium]|nr:hypothetical protein [Patescibacteria group bacterium]